MHCGDIHGTMLYYTDDMSKGGSSTIVEVTRQGTEYVFRQIFDPFNIFLFVLVLLAILDLQQLLSEKIDKHGNPLDLPRELILQFDNCPENKVRFVYFPVVLCSSFNFTFI